jgi:hypothetical protein
MTTLARAPVRSPAWLKGWPHATRWGRSPWGSTRKLASAAGQETHDTAIAKIRNIGIIAHVDAVRIPHGHPRIIDISDSRVPRGKQQPLRLCSTIVVLQGILEVRYLPTQSSTFP